MTDLPERHANGTIQVTRIGTWLATLVDGAVVECHDRKQAIRVCTRTTKGLHWERGHQLYNGHVLLADVRKIRPILHLSTNSRRLQKKQGSWYVFYTDKRIQGPLASQAAARIAAEATAHHTQEKSK